jgi:Ca2+-binding EF-hand superfamily protein
MGYLKDLDEVSSLMGEDGWQESATIAFKVYDKDEDGLLNPDEFDMFTEQMYALQNDDMNEEDM